MVSRDFKVKCASSCFLRTLRWKKVYKMPHFSVKSLALGVYHLNILRENNDSFLVNFFLDF